MASAEKGTVEVEKTVVTEEPVVVLTLTPDEASLLRAVIGALSAGTYRDANVVDIYHALEEKSEYVRGHYMYAGNRIGAPKFVTRELG